MKYKRINLALSEELGEKIRVIAHTEWVSVNALVVKAIEEYISKREGKVEKQNEK